MKLLKDERYPTGIPAHLDPHNVIRKGRIQRAGTKMYRHEITEMQRMLNPQHVLGSGMTPAQLWKWYRNTVANQQVMHYGTTEHKQVFSTMHNVTRRSLSQTAG